MFLLSGSRILETAYFASVVLSVIPFGAVYPYLIGLTCACFAILAMAAQLLPSNSKTLERVNSRLSLTIFGLLGAFGLQSLQFDGNPFASAVWSGQIEGLGKVAGAISVNPGATREAMVTFSVPCFAALAALRIFQDDAAAVRLWQFLAKFGALLIGLTLLQDLIFPRTLLIYEKWAYNNDFTLTFVNRNTAATEIGVILLLNLGLLLYRLIAVRRDRLLKQLLAFDLKWGDRHGQVLLQALICFMIFMGLVLTRSRAGIGSTILSSLALGCIVIAYNPPAFMQKGRIALAVTATMLVISVLAFLSLFGGVAVERVAEEGFEDTARLCTYQSIIHAIGDRWLLGWGFGTFADVFPSYRDASCTGIGGIWDRAHDSYLEFILGAGILGLFFLLYVFWLIGSTLLRGLKDRQSMKFAPAAAIAILILVSLHSLVDFSLQIPGVAVFVTASLVCGMVISANGPTDKSCRDNKNT
jgi:O-antigen ligase